MITLLCGFFFLNTAGKFNTLLSFLINDFKLYLTKSPWQLHIYLMCVLCIITQHDNFDRSAYGCSELQLLSLWVFTNRIVNTRLVSDIFRSLVLPWSYKANIANK